MRPDYGLFDSAVIRIVTGYILVVILAILLISLAEYVHHIRNNRLLEREQQSQQYSR